MAKQKATKPDVLLDIAEQKERENEGVKRDLGSSRRIQGGKRIPHSFGEESLRELAITRKIPRRHQGRLVAPQPRRVSGSLGNGAV